MQTRLSSQSRTSLDPLLVCKEASLSRLASSDEDMSSGTSFISRACQNIQSCMLTRSQIKEKQEYEKLGSEIQKQTLALISFLRTKLPPREFSELIKRCQKQSIQKNDEISMPSSTSSHSPPPSLSMILASLLYSISPSFAFSNVENSMQYLITAIDFWFMRFILLLQKSAQRRTRSFVEPVESPLEVWMTMNEAYSYYFKAKVIEKKTEGRMVCDLLHPKEKLTDIRHVVNEEAKSYARTSSLLRRITMKDVYLVLISDGGDFLPLDSIQKYFFASTQYASASEYKVRNTTAAANT